MCGGPEELPVGQNRQYNIIEIEADSESNKHLKVILHTREKTYNSSSENPIWAKGRIESTNISFFATHIPKPIQITSNNDDLFDIEVLIRERKYEEAEERLLKLDLSNPFVRKFLLKCLIQSEDHKTDHETICKIYYPPQNNEETVYLLNYLLQLNDKDMMAKCIKHPFIKDSNDPTVKELRTKIENYLS